jgi:Uncharacterised nucleotidyltransferase
MGGLRRIEARTCAGQIDAYGASPHLGSLSMTVGETAYPTSDNEQTPCANEELWGAVADLLDSASLPGILAHKLGPLAAWRLRERGDPVPGAVREEARAASLAFLTAAPLVARIRESCDGALILLKGPEVAYLYPSHARRFVDVDILAHRPVDVYESLLAAGFVHAPEPEELGDDHHHLPPLKWPTLALAIEVHASPNWMPGTHPAPLGEIFEAAQPSALGIEGVYAPSPLHHALILASHAWRHAPLDTVRDLVDVAAMTACADAEDVTRTAAAWRMDRVWKQTARAVDALFYGGPRSVPLRTWARHLPAVREQSVFASDLRNVVAPFWAVAPHHAARYAGRAMADAVRPGPGERWSDSLARALKGLRDPTAPVGSVRGGDDRSTRHGQEADG